MTLGFRDLRGADTGIETGCKKGTVVPPAAFVQQVESVITAAVSAPGKDGAEFQAAADWHAYGVPGGVRRLTRPGRPTR
jgi:hypothetical protein